MDPTLTHDDDRRIVHIDMDAFYASVEQRDNPALRGKPVAVGGARQRGVVAAASYEARAFGVHSALPSVTAARRCPDLIFVRPRFDVYKAVSDQIRQIFAEATPLIEPLSLDEAYLDVTGRLGQHGTASALARHIRARIRAETGLTASAGVSYCKFLAKMASGQRKPDGQFVIPPLDGPAFIAALPIGKFHGIGPATAARMAQAGIHYGADLLGWPREALIARFGKSGGWYHDLARGIDRRPVRVDRIRKSVGAERTFSEDLTDLAPARAALGLLAEKVWSHLDGKGLAGRTVTLKMKFNDFTQITRRRTLALPVADQAMLLDHACALLAAEMPFSRPVRLLGITLSGFAADPPAQTGQLSLF